MELSRSYKYTVAGARRFETPTTSPAPPQTLTLMSPAAAATELRHLDKHVWKACAGPAARVPAVGALVYYFPEGHVWQASSPPDLSALPCRAPFALCRVSAVAFLADPDTDEAFARILLDPRPSSEHPPSLPAEEQDDGSGVMAFVKVLTTSDANNGGGFSVPRFCADSILPPLDLKTEAPVQNLTVFDTQGRIWQFRHIYRGRPRRHLLTTGWSKFVNSKKLVAGDSVVFVRNRNDELILGVRRTYAASAGGAGARPGEGEGFSQGLRERVPPATVVEAIRLMEMGRPFEVLYYPRAGSTDFLVSEEAVEATMRVHWRPGLRVRMAVDTEDSTKTMWLQGTVSAVAVRDVGPWPGSPWRMLQVRWDDPEVLQNVRSVNPWQVELMASTTYIQAPYPAMKKLKVPQSPELFSDGGGSMFFPMTGFNASLTGSLIPSLSNYTAYPAGMQGARHSVCVSSLSNFVPKNNREIFSGDLCSINMLPKLENVSIELSIGSASQSQGSSPPSQESIHDNSTELLSVAACSATRETSEVTFQLFGQVIHMKKPVGGDVDKKYNENKDGVKSLDFSLSYSNKRLFDGLDVQS